ncbi:GPI mannosyltransferase 2 [Cucumispora dikerogammari]|nr:GPI mannosyltransferase 2 [Cucumispora dikerogammari]
MIITYFKILYYSFYSRLFFIIFSTISSLIISPYDKSTNLLNLSHFQSLIRWDAIYFHDISTNNYTTIQQTAFFPLYPLIIKYLNNKLTYYNIKTNITITGIILSNLLFIINSALLYNLLLKISNNNINLKKYILIYNFYPTTIINSSFYSESLFFFIILMYLNLLSLFYDLYNRKGFLLVFKYVLIIMSYILIIISCLCRSNGILFSVTPLFLKHKGPYYINIIFFIILGFCCYLIIDLFQLYIYKLFKIKNSYYFVQSYIWDQGILKFYEFQKRPENLFNLLIAMPFLYGIGGCLWKFFVDNKFIYNKPENCQVSAQSNYVLYTKPGIINKTATDVLHFYKNCFLKYKHNSKLTINKHSQASFYANSINDKLTDIHKTFITNNFNENIKTLLITILAIQIILQLLCFHLQTLMRFISINPIVYYLLIKYGSPKFNKFCFFYSIWYCVLFSCYYPPT